MKVVAATGAVRVSERVRIRANSSSFQEKMNERIADTTMPGAARGRAMRRKIWNRPSPSSIAASSSSRGSERNWSEQIQTTIGRLKVR